MKPMWKSNQAYTTGYNSGMTSFRIPVNFGAGPYFYTTEGGTTVIKPMEELMECNKMKPFLFCIIKHPTPKQVEEGVGSFLIHKLDLILARDEAQAQVLAGRHIKEEDMGASDRIEVVVRPF